MRRLIALFVLWFVVLGSIAHASEQEGVRRIASRLGGTAATQGPGPLAAAAAREVHLMVELAVQPPTQRRRWISRHPVKSGALIGAGAGLAWGVVFVYTDTFEQHDSPPTGASFAGMTLVMGPLLGAGLGALAIACWNAKDGRKHRWFDVALAKRLGWDVDGRGAPTDSPRPIALPDSINELL